ncbi:enoyl-CoA hydratase-related protein [Streptomyces somaliensis]|uniref:enoyl-CoA hydratase/isomerase family protein n=1 Tax=Streptomyces somaliensis TaxID=78355 RepID=UPI0020CE66D5|nr:enoyl-CoA hydratase-related protein [Streptomyces somaliensis]MCP9946647.1 enoyl-CoA hydratase-related protein [Streptomyces somaliensis]MCP9963390.1 enoyl-CoA hydratase-related protein [Streptomyces somaliensis]MCP9972982.1 enoyl-CoA hydratase-related protein [Streptomyces somaliensis]
MTESHEDILVDDWERGIRRITINRPAVRNAYRSRTAVEIADAVADFHADDAQRVLVITGSGGSFCSGGDLTSGYEVEHAHAVQFGHAKVLQEGMHRVMRRLELCDKPVIAMISGAAVAGGLSLAMACDVRIADRTARLGDTSGRVGLLPDEGGAWFFSRAMGPDRALRMLWGAEVYGAERARELGLLTEVVDEAELENAVLDLARRFAATAPLTTKVVKRLVRHAERQTLDQALQEAEFAVELINERDDVREGVSAFVEKRSPRFRGR